MDLANPLANSSNEDTKVDPAQQKSLWCLIGVSVALLLLAYLNSIFAVADAWNSPQYSHGYLIPVFAGFLLWMRREPLAEASVKEKWIGVALVALGVAIRLYGAHEVFFTVDHISLIPCLLGVFVMVGGLRTLRWAGPPLLLLAFMYPWPGFMVDGIMRPLKLTGTWFAEYTLQTLGIDAYAEGNIIHLENSPMEVADACSGLRMLTIFIALAAAMAMLMRDRPWWERLVVLISALPIALLVNAIRITLLGLVFSFVGDENELAKKVLHDFAGLVMMPMAIGFLWLEMRILAKLFIEESDAPAQTIGIGLS